MMEGKRMQKVGVVGGGLMGSGIAEVSARAGLDVVVVESSPEAAEAARGRMATSLERAESKGKIASAADVLSKAFKTFSHPFKCFAKKSSALLTPAWPTSALCRCDAQ